MGILDNTKLRFRVENLEVQYISLKRSCSGRGSLSCSVQSCLESLGHFKLWWRRGVGGMVCL